MPADRVLIDVWFLNLFVAATESETTVAAIGGVLRQKAFRVALRRAVRRVLRRHPPLAALTFTLTR